MPWKSSEAKSHTHKAAIEMAIDYEDMVAIGANLNSAISRVLKESHELSIDAENELTAAIAQAVLVQLDQAGYQITRK